MCKRFTIGTTDGFVVDILGPFRENANNPQIVKYIIDDSYGLPCQLMKPGDILILNRGCRDIMGYLQYSSQYLPLKGKRKQLTTRESNDSHFVTKLRWAVD